METSFTKGVNAVSWVLIRFMLVMVPLVFFINGITKGRLAGGIPVRHFHCCRPDSGNAADDRNHLPCQRCCVHEQESRPSSKTSIPSRTFGAIDILCTDKTGTLTQDKVVLEYHLNVNGEDDTRVLRHAYLNSYFQTGYKNLMDLAIIRRTEEEEAADPQLTGSVGELRKGRRDSL